MLLASMCIIAWSVLTITVCHLLALPERIDQIQLDAIISAIGFCFGIVFYGLSIRRLKDLNMPRWTVKLLGFPLLALMLMPYLVLVSGPQTENQYGSAQRSSGFGKLTLAAIAMFLAFHLSFNAITTFYAARHFLAATSPP